MKRYYRTLLAQGAVNLLVFGCAYADVNVESINYSDGQDAISLSVSYSNVACFDVSSESACDTVSKQVTIKLTEFQSQNPCLSTAPGTRQHLFPIKKLVQAHKTCGSEEKVNIQVEPAKSNMQVSVKGSAISKYNLGEVESPKPVQRIQSTSSKKAN